MTIKQIFYQMRDTILDKGYKDNFIDDYIKLLENIVKNQPQNFKAISLLAIAYLENREETEKSTDILEKALADYSESMSSSDLVELLNNLAYFYVEWAIYDCDREQFLKAKEMLERCIKLTSLPIPYHMLGLIYLRDNEVDKAASVLKEAARLCSEKKYQNNYAAALYRSGQTAAAKQIFLSISAGWETEEDAQTAYLSYGFCECIEGNKGKGLEVAENLYKVLKSEEKICYIDESDLADLYFLCGEYEKCLYVYDNGRQLVPHVCWLKVYFYCLYQLGMKDMINDRYQEIITDMKEHIDDLAKDSDWDNEDDKNEYMKSIRCDMEDIIELYQTIINGTYIQEYQFTPHIIYGCYLINCPRHTTEYID